MTKFPLGIRGDHVHVRAVVIADRKLAGWIVHCARTMAGAHARPHVRRLAQRAVRRHRKYRDIAAPEIGDEHEFAGGVHAGIGGRGAGRTHRTQSFDLEILAVDRVGHDRAAARSLVIVDLADRIQMRTGGVDGEPGRIANIVEYLQSASGRRSPGPGETDRCRRRSACKCRHRQRLPSRAARGRTGSSGIRLSVRPAVRLP